MLVNCRNFEIRAAKDLASKGLTFVNWTDSIIEGQKGNILAMYGLCMMFGKHALVHLHGSIIWSTLDSLGESHSIDLEKCDIHLCYLGRGVICGID